MKRASKKFPSHLKKKIFKIRKRKSRVPPVSDPPKLNKNEARAVKKIRKN